MSGSQPDWQWVEVINYWGNAILERLDKLVDQRSRLVVDPDGKIRLLHDTPDDRLADLDAAWVQWPMYPGYDGSAVGFKNFLRDRYAKGQG